jgi:pyruvate kinase
VNERDRHLISLARDLGVDFIGVSFVESAQHVQTIRDLVQRNTPQVLAKIENQSGIDNLDEIVDAADAIMIDRGDLSVETSLEILVFYQKRIIQSARERGKPVIVATEMLSSMIENEVPLKAEVADITNAVLDGCSAVMLSGETAIGRSPVGAVRVMRRIADATCQHLMTRSRSDERFFGPTPPQAIEDAIANILKSLPVTKVVAITRGGYAARMLSARMVAQPIIAVSDDEATARAFNIYSGVEGVYCDVPFPQGSADHVKACLHKLYELGKLDPADLILVTGVVYPRSGTRMNLIQIHKVADLVEEFAWEPPPQSTSSIRL